MILYLAETVVNDLLRDGKVSTGDRQRVIGLVESVIRSELEIEDKLNEEARALLELHYEEVRASGAGYHELFGKVKARLAKEKGIIL